MQHRQCERRRLARARCRLREQVAPLQHQRNRLALNRSRLLVAERRDRRDDGVVEAERGESARGGLRSYERAFWHPLYCRPPFDPMSMSDGFRVVMLAIFTPVSCVPGRPYDWRHAICTHRGADPARHGAGAAETGPAQAARPLPGLAVSDNKRFLVTADGRPFFCLGDTAWELFHRLNREEAERYLENRAAKGFTVIQAVALAELDGLNDAERLRPPAADRQRPGTPGVKDGPDNDYWDHVDYIVDKAERARACTSACCRPGATSGTTSGAPGRDLHAGERRGLRRVARRALQGQGASSGSSAATGRSRTTTHKEIIRAMARGLRRGRRRRPPDDVPPAGRRRARRQWFHDDDWLDFNMRQNGHVAEFTGRYDQTRADYDRTPVKPVLDGEPIYEDHPVSFKAKELGPLDRRRRAPAAVLGPVHRRVRPHLRPPLRLADVGARAEARSTTR